jgi:predicted PurR-regulated permease PerM
MAQSSKADAFSRGRVLSVALMIVTAVVFYLCWLMAQPFLAALVWSLTLAIVGMPLHRWIRRHVAKPGLAAMLSVAAVCIVIVAPAFFLTQRLVIETGEAIRMIAGEIKTGALRRELMASPTLAGIVGFIERNVDVRDSIQQLVTRASGPAGSVVSGSIWALIEVLIVFFCLFYFFRDREAVITTARGLVPLSRAESDRLFSRVNDTVEATVFGTLVVAAIQGTLGGLMFWWLGLPLPLLWGVVMALLAIIPILGAFVIWIPAAIYLALHGEVLSAVILTVWGAVVIGLIDNLMYPILVGNRLRLHTLPVFFSIVGGLSVFGASGLIIGPVVLSVADGLVDVWRSRLEEAG